MADGLYFDLDSDKGGPLKLVRWEAMKASLTSIARWEAMKASLTSLARWEAIKASLTKDQFDFFLFLTRSAPVRLVSPRNISERDPGSGTSVVITSLTLPM